jgi:hypothetical protein
MTFNNNKVYKKINSSSNFYNKIIPIFKNSNKNSYEIDNSKINIMSGMANGINLLNQNLEDFSKTKKIMKTLRSNNVREIIPKKTNSNAPMSFLTFKRNKLNKRL